MTRRILILFAAVWLMLVSTEDVQAARWRRPARRVSGHVRVRGGHAFKRASHVAGRHDYSRRLWNLGKQNGEWPSFP